MGDQLDDLPKLGRRPVNLKCPGCRNRIITIIKKKSTAKTHMIVASLCMIGLFCIAPFMYCSDCARSTEHYCPICHIFLGVVNG